jgi:hypothetical protein
LCAHGGSRGNARPSRPQSEPATAGGGRSGALLLHVQILRGQTDLRELGGAQSHLGRTRMLLRATGWLVRPRRRCWSSNYTSCLMRPTPPCALMLDRRRRAPVGASMRQDDLRTTIGGIQSSRRWAVVSFAPAVAVLALTACQPKDVAQGSSQTTSN